MNYTPRVLVALGTRPEIIKLAPIIWRLRDFKEFDPLVVWSGQHADLALPLIDSLMIRPNIHFDAVATGSSLGELTSGFIAKYSALFERERIAASIVQGDTATAFGAATASFLNRVPVAHVEAGLRSGDPLDPYPEEGLRKAISAIATLHLAPTPYARDNLLAESVSPDSIYVTGNTVVDTVLNVARRDVMLDDALDQRVRGAEQVVTVTMHRRENLDAGLEQVLLGVYDVSLRMNKVLFVFPMHLNPRVRRVAMKVFADAQNVLLIDPLGYEQFISLIRRSAVVLTDSGGIQEECPSLEVPVLIARQSTERPEAIRAGLAQLIGVKRSDIANNVSRALRRQSSIQQRMPQPNPFGDGEAAGRCISGVASMLGTGSRLPEFTTSSSAL